MTDTWFVKNIIHEIGSFMKIYFKSITHMLYTYYTEDVRILNII